MAAGAAAPRRAGTVFGDVWIDLRGLRTDADRIEPHLCTVFGDVDVTVSEGVDAELHSWTLFGDRTTELAPVPRLAGRRSPSRRHRSDATVLTPPFLDRRAQASSSLRSKGTAE
jgi:hypothetical protein